MTRPVIVPVPLGCCPDTPRCLLCPPPPAVDADLVEALLASYRQDSDGPLEVRFFGGAPPSDALLEVVGDLPVMVRVRPDLLTRAEAARLAARGVVSVELDALSFDNAVLRATGRRYRSALVHQISKGLAEVGLRVGGVLSPGLPGHSHAAALEDARQAASLWSFVRLHPVLVLDRSALRDLHAARRYEPLDLGEAVTTCREMLDLFDDAGVEVVRVGLQPGPDGFGKAVAGPLHSALRELVEARRMLDRLRALASDVPRGATVTLACAPADETRTRGMYNRNVRTLRAEFGMHSLTVTADPTLARGEVRLTTHQENQ